MRIWPVQEIMFESFEDVHVNHGVDDLPWWYKLGMDYPFSIKKYSDFLFVHSYLFWERELHRVPFGFLPFHSRFIFKDLRLISVYYIPYSIQNHVHVVPEFVPFFTISFIGAISHHNKDFNS